MSPFDQATGAPSKCLPASLSGSYTGPNSKGIYRFRVQTGKLTTINQQPSMGIGLCPLVWDKYGKKRG